MFENNSFRQVPIDLVLYFSISYLLFCSSVVDSVYKTNNTYKNHSSILLMKQKL